MRQRNPGCPRPLHSSGRGCLPRGWFPELAWRCAADGSHNCTAGSPLRRSALTRSSPPSAPRDLAPSECPAAAACRLPWECIAASPVAADIFPPGARLQFPQGTAHACCSIIDSVSPSMPAAPLLLRTRFHASSRTSLRQIRSYSAWKRRVRLAWPHEQPALEFSHFFNGVVGRLRPCPRAYLLTRHDQSRVPSLQRVVARRLRYYEPLGLPPGTIPFRHRLIGTAFARRGPPGRVSPVPYLHCSACRPPVPRGRPASLRFRRMQSVAFAVT